jgi:hypothetical protein
METSTKIYFEIRHGNGTIANAKKESFFSQKQEAIDAATEFKNNPRSHNDLMTDANVLYWKSQSFTIVEKVVTTIIHETI